MTGRNRGPRRSSTGRKKLAAVTLEDVGREQSGTGVRGRSDTRFLKTNGDRDKSGDG